MASRSLNSLVHLVLCGYIISILLLHSIFYSLKPAGKHFFITHYEKNCKSPNGKLRGCWDSWRLCHWGNSIYAAAVNMCQHQIVALHCARELRIKSSLGLTGDATFERRKNLVVRLNPTADKQLNPLLPVLLWDTAVMRNDKGITVFSADPGCWKGEAWELLVLLILSHVKLHAVSVLSHKTLNPAVIQTPADSPLNLPECVDLWVW